jgi:hypothetical protein
MQGRTKEELYQSFIEFVGNDVQRERRHANRRMIYVFIWCLFLPAVVSATILLLIRFHVFPRWARGYADWAILLFPVLYSLYVLSREVLAEIPQVFRKGGIFTTLGHATREGEWRRRVCDAILTGVPASAEEWKWVVTSFRMDLTGLKQRTSHLTALAGAVFFLILHGIDSLGDNNAIRPVPTANAVLGWVESANNDISQMIALALFLVLFYLSGSQTYYSLTRYMNCAELVLVDLAKRERLRRSVD